MNHYEGFANKFQIVIVTRLGIRVGELAETINFVKLLTH
jgi:hypothetical protein